MRLYLVGGLEHEFHFPSYWELSSSHLTFTPSVFRGVAKKHQPDMLQPLLVRGLEHVLFSPIVGMMIQSDELHHFSGG